MNPRYYFDPERDMPTINRHPEARHYPSPDEVRAQVSGGQSNVSRFDDEEDDPDRCPTCGRAEDCECQGCGYCDEHGTPWGNEPKAGTKRLKPHQGDAV
jgi:hypothetical protein